MDGQASGPWWVVVMAALPSAASGAWIAYRWWVDRQDRREGAQVTAALTREERIQRDLETQRAALSADQARVFDQMRAELARLRPLLEETEYDRDRGWELCRWWNRRAHELRHAGINAQQIASNLAMAAGHDLPAWPDMTIPLDIEAPIPRRHP